MEESDAGEATSHHLHRVGSARVLEVFVDYAVLLEVGLEQVLRGTVRGRIRMFRASALGRFAVVAVVSDPTAARLEIDLPEPWCGHVLGASPNPK